MFKSQKLTIETINSINTAIRIIHEGLKPPTMREQLKMNRFDAVTWQAAILLTGKRSILTKNQSKLSKADGINFINAGLTMSPHKEASEFFERAFNHCPFATEACALACVGAETGQGRLPSSKIARIGRTVALHFDPVLFEKLIHLEIQELEIEARKRETLTGENWRIAFRANIASDNTQFADELAMMCHESDRFGYSVPNRRIVFYDYTVIPKAVIKNYGFVNRVYSRKDSTNEKQCLEVLKKGFGVAVVFAGDLPKTWKGYPVIDGDINDLWFTRKPEKGGFVVGLKVKGSNAQKQACINSGFAISTKEIGS